MRTTLRAIGAASLSAGVFVCGATGAAAATGAQVSARPRSGPGLSLARLASLENYRFTSKSSNDGYSFEITGMVHGPEDWEARATSPVSELTFDVGGRGYAVVLGRVEPVHFSTAEGLTHLDGERTFAQALVGYTHVRGIRIATKGRCQVAGRSGTVYALATPRDAAGLILETASACVATGSGALLSYTSGVPSGSAAAAVNLRGATSTFRVEAVGGVGPISAPKAPPATTVPSVPSTTGRPTGLPAGFPTEVPAPPGTLLSSARIGPSKWYLQLTEKRASALEHYASELEARGFAVTSSSNSSAADLEQLAKGSLEVLLEQLAFPGEGVTLAVTVQAAT